MGFGRKKIVGMVHCALFVSTANQGNVTVERDLKLFGLEEKTYEACS